MTPPPTRPKIYHITHVDNLARIIADAGLVSDRVIMTRGGPAQMIGMSTIKRRRIEELRVDCHPGTRVGDYVPFYFCPRSVMLFVIHCANHVELAYRGGQEPILHLEADLDEVIRWADANGVRWAFSLSNAGARYTEFRSRREKLDELNWPAIAARDFRDAEIKEAKQAEFLLHERFPFHLVERIGVRSGRVHALAAAATAGAAHRPPIEVRSEWYY
jgi:hypothetical protein